MLQLKQPHFFHRSPSRSQQGQMAFSPVPADDDELIQAIEATHPDNAWTLSNEPDVVGLENFWNEVTADIEKDPEWFTFSND